MSQIGTSAEPLRVAIIGSGPAGFYVLGNLQKHRQLCAHADMYEKLPTPFGLVRAGVAPDHQKDKTVARAFDRSAASSTFRFFGNVEFGRHLTLDDARRHYHQVVFATGAQTGRDMGIRGESAGGCHSASDFVAWYNGHPDYARLDFDLAARSVAIVGLGNVAIDVARILCKAPDELAGTDVADYALEALRASRIEEVYLLGRRGPAEAAFTPPEIEELGALPDVDVLVRPDEAGVDEVSRNALTASGDRNAAKNVDIIRRLSERPVTGRHKRLIIRFKVSPTELIADEAGKVAAIRLVRNELFLRQDGSVGCRATDGHEELPVQLVFRSVGYRSLELPGLPYDADRGLIPNAGGRVVDADGRPMAGVYAVGWVKRGASGVIGTNKLDAKETVACMVEDAAAGRCFAPGEPRESITELIRLRQPRMVTYEEWAMLDDIEVRKGSAADRPRVKFTDVAEMLRALRR